MTVGDRIKICREQNGLSQVGLAKKVGISKQTLYKYENNIITNIPNDKVEALAEILKVTPGYLMGWNENLKTDFYDLLPDIMSDKDMLECIEKLNNLTKEHQQTIFDTVAYWYEKEGH